MPGVRIDDVTAAAVAEALRRTSSLKEAAALLDRSRGFIYDSLKRRQREWLTADWVGYGAELRRRRLLAGWSVAQLARMANVSTNTLHHVENGRGTLRPSALTLAKLAAALGMPVPPAAERAGR
jgi:DNA-binding XRE family transcriptional regulator